MLFCLIVKISFFLFILHNKLDKKEKHDTLYTIGENAEGINTMSKNRLYESIRDKLMLELLNGHFQPGEIFATDEILCERFKAGRNTVRHAVRQLIEAGFLNYRRHVGICIGEKCVKHGQVQPEGKVLIMIPYWSYVNGNKYESLLLPVLSAGEGLSQPYQVEFVSTEEFEETDKDLAGRAEFVLAVDPGEKCLAKIQNYISTGGKVLLMHPEEQISGCCCVKQENICLDVVRFFYELGHRHIGMVCNFRGHQSYWKWMSHFVRAMNELSLPILPGALCDGHLLHEYNGESLDRVTAWICINRRNLNHLLEFSRKKNLKIPEDLSVICTDEAESNTPGIGNLNWDFQSLARLIDQQFRYYVPGTYYLPFSLDPRQSVAPPKQVQKGLAN